MAVIAALEFDDLVPPGKAARQANGAHGRFCAGGDHAHHFDGWHQLANLVGHLCFERGRGAKREPLAHHGFNGLDHLRMGVSEDHWSPGADIINIAVSVCIIEPGSCCRIDKKRVAANAFKSAYR